jgi:hypothetical protein
MTAAGKISSESNFADRIGMNGDDEAEEEADQYQEADEQMQREQLERFLQSDDRQSKRNKFLKSEIMKTLDFKAPPPAKQQKSKKRGFLDAVGATSSSTSKRRPANPSSGKSRSDGRDVGGSDSDDSAEDKNENSFCSGGDGTALFLEDIHNIIVMTHGEAGRIGNPMRELGPHYVIMYDADTEFIRLLEIYSAETKNYLKVYMLSYGKLEHFTP